MSQPRIAEADIIDRLFAAMGQGDGSAARACCTPDAVFWHCFDNVAQTLDASITAWAGLRTNFPEFGLEDARRTRTEDGRIVSQHRFVGRRTDGQTVAWDVCLLVALRDGLIARIDEYIDRAAAFPFEAKTPADSGTF